MIIIPTPCYTCGSKECSPSVCRFANTVSSRPIDFEVEREVERDERMDELREMWRHPERYR